MADLYRLSQYFLTTLSVAGGIDASQTTDIVLQAVTGIDEPTKPGIALLNYSDPLETSACEWITYTSVNTTTKELQGVSRGQEDYSAKAHANGATVAFPLSKSHINNIVDKLEGLDTGVTLDTPTLTSPTITTPTIDTIADTRVNPRTTTEVSSATPTINTDNTDIHTITAQAAAITSFTTNLSGTPVNGQKLVIRIKDNNTARAITWGASFASRGATLPTTTTKNKTTYVGFFYNSTAEVWDCVATVTEA